MKLKKLCNTAPNQKKQQQISTISISTLGKATMLTRGGFGLVYESMYRFRAPEREKTKIYILE